MTSELVFTESKLKYCVKVKISDGPHETPSFLETGIPFLSVDGIQNGEIVLEKCRFISEEDHKKYNKKIKVEENDLLMGKAASIGKIARVKFNRPISVWSPLAVIKCNTDIINPIFLEYFLKSDFIQNQIQILATSNTQKNISMRDIERIKILYPNLSEQNIISRYLDNKTQKIDLLIEKIEKKIELLKEQKTTLINQFVTRGLHPKVEMKDSRVEWLGFIPKHWKVLKFKYITELITCGYASTPEYVDNGIMFLSAQNIKNGSLNLSKFRNIRNDLHALLSRKNKIEKGDLLQVRVGATIGETCIVDIDNSFSIYVSLSHIKLKKLVNNQYIKFLCNCSRFRESSTVEMKQGGGVPNLNVSDLERYKIPIPPKTEQEEISNYLKDKIDNFNKIIEKLKIKKNLLEEYRQSLISSLVTGEIRITEA